MNIKILLHVSKDLDDSKEVVERLVKENLENKLDHYLKQFKKEDSEWTIDLKVEKNKKWLFNAVIQANLDGQSFRYEREDYKKMDDLINHLFDHFKEELSK